MKRFLQKYSALLLTFILILAAIIGIGVSYQKALIAEQEQDALRLTGNFPVAQLNAIEFDWGDISRGKVVTKDFILSNTGNTDLEITKIMTSCGCTTAELLFNENSQTLPAKIPASSQGVIRVRFDPDTMKSRGNVTRAVRIETNDPDRPFLIINLRANVR